MILYVILAISILSLGFAFWKALNIMKKSPGTEKMQEISDLIHKGAMTFLKKEYIILSIFIVIVTAALYYFIGQNIAIAFVLGAVFSATAGNIGMRIATKSNARAAEGAKKSINEGLVIAFSSGTVMGLSVVGIGLLGVTLLYMIFNDPSIIYGFGFGASSIALFARVGGGIYTKAADVGADLVGKVEAGIPEDDPRNPAVIADNVGDNVGDIAGMGADLFESYVDSIIAAMVIGTAIMITTNISKGYVVLPLILAALGIISSVIGTLFVKVTKGKAQHALDKGIWAASISMSIFSFIAIKYIIPNSTGTGVFYCVMSGLVAGIIIGLVTEYYTSNSKKPAQKVAEAAKTGAGTNLIQGLAVGMLSTWVPVLTICAAIFVSYHFSGLYGIAIAAVGMLSTLGITLATDCYGPVADNAAGIAEMAKLGGPIRKRCESLDAVGNTTAAIGKGFAIGSAALTALALFASFTQVAAQLTGKTTVIDITTPNVIIGLFIGGMIPFLFSALAMKAVGKAAESIVIEVRRQFKQIKGLMEGKAKPDSNKCISIVTEAALREMILPTLITIAAPIIVGLTLGIGALGGLLAGVTVTGFLMAVFMANSGAVWDNAKKYIEAGHFGGKGSDAHKAAVVGDTVGDPMKDTSGPSLNILIKLMSIVALVFLPLFI
ncbi:MAG: sodium-translocating pyrophosphatase [Nanoarchaeota archaeon]|nr:sodium-translocating pyrophosphatase [Nanoarchaeota archaeon]MBU1004778.1 sodium-translocating pyrophosphatase [Nanoarchaeota archaeon]MBU1945552.1 sodium-translocating pyrophosphatase [Nanoarchaeota archaeon]